MPFVFLVFVAIATGAASAYAGRDEIRHSGGTAWRTEAFLAYALYVGLVLLPTVVYFYVFHSDWFLLYWIDTAQAPWIWGALTVLLLLGSALGGFQLAAALCRSSRDLAARRITVGIILIALLMWPMGWERLSQVGSHRQYVRDYGLVAFFSSPAFYAGLFMLAVCVGSFVWVYFRIDRQTRDMA